MPSVKSRSAGVLLATLSRSGGGFTLNCLSKHPWIIAEAYFGWRKDMNIGMGDMDGQKRLLDALLHRPGFAASVVKAMHPTMMAFPVSFWKEMNVSIIYQERRNILRCAAAAMAKWQQREGIKVPWTFPPEEFLELLDSRKQELVDIHAKIDEMEQEGFPVLRVFYRDLVGGEANQAEEIQPSEAQRICEFLNVEHYRPWSPIKRNHPWALKDMVANWDELRPMIEGTEYAEWLEEEALYE